MHGWLPLPMALTRLCGVAEAGCCWAGVAAAGRRDVRIEDGVRGSAHSSTVARKTLRKPRRTP